MRSLFASGHAVDIVLFVVLLEVIALVVRNRLTKKRPAPLELVRQLAAGVLLLLAVRSALTGADYRWTALFLTASGPAHIFDLARRRG